MILALDIDGTLAAFVPAFAQLARDLLGKTVPAEADCWNWHRKVLTEAEDTCLWTWIRAHPGWWERLAPEPGALDLLTHLNVTAHEVYFLTNRPRSAKSATELWLGEAGYDNPTVLMVEEKGRIMQGLGVEAAIDDKPAHCLNIVQEHPTCAVALLERPYNREMADQWREWRGWPMPRIAVVPTLDAWLTLVETEGGDRVLEETC